jgi:hypothetical protein
MSAPAAAGTAAMPRHEAAPEVRAQTIADTRRMLDWLEANPGIPLRAWGFEILVGADGREAVDDLAEAMGVTASHTTSAHRAVKRFGLASYVAYAANLEVAP